MRSSPQEGFSCAIRRISSRRFLGTHGLPRGLDFHRQRRRKPFRCQPRNVSGLTLTKAFCHAKSRENRTIDRRVASVARCGLSSRSRYRASCLRRKMFSALMAALERVPSRRNRRASLARARRSETKQVKGWAVLMGLGACHGYAGRNNPHFLRICDQILRVPIFLRSSGVTLVMD